jgi:predicted anti-sigma-YlaC factor YlaD
MTGPAGLPRFCREARSQFPALAAGELSGWPLHVTQAHVRRCADCAAELARQEQLATALASLREAPPAAPEGLLDELLASPRLRGARARAAVPARGAVSGARPGLSITFLTVGAVASTAAGYGAWRAARALRTRHSR